MENVHASIRVTERARTKAAAEARRIRVNTSELGIKRELVNLIARDRIKQITRYTPFGHAVTRPALKRALSNILELLEIPDRDYSTEYYSACGMDDYQDDLRIARKSHARVLLDALLMRM